MTLLNTADTSAPTSEMTAVALAATRATTFLRGQAQWLQRGLTHSGDRVAVDIVLSAHDRSHDRWVNLVRLVEDCLGEEAAAQVSTLYSYVGRVAGSLDNGAMESLCPDVAAQVRQLTSDRLGELTELAVEALWAAAAQA